MEILTESKQKTELLNFSPAAQQRVIELLSFAQDPKTCLRIYIAEQSCSGLECGFAFELPDPEDVVISFEGFSVIIDPISFTYLKGSTIDCVSTEQGSSLVLNTPMLKSSCGGCGCGGGSC